MRREEILAARASRSIDLWVFGRPEKNSRESGCVGSRGASGTDAFVRATFGLGTAASASGATSASAVLVDLTELAPSIYYLQFKK